MSEQKLYIGNLPYRTREGDVREHFRGYGPIYSVILIYDPETGRTRGYGFIELEDSAAEAVLRELNDTKFMGRNLKIRKANQQYGYEEEQKKNDAEDCGKSDSPNIDAINRNSLNGQFMFSNTDTGGANGKNMSGCFGEYGDFKREEFKGLNVNGKYYNIERRRYGLYHAYKFMGNKMNYSGPSNISPVEER